MDKQVRDFKELRDSGLLWLINRVVLHPRGYAMSLVYEGDKDDLEECVGWQLLGDGTECWSFSEEIDDEKFKVIKELLK